MGTNMKIVPTLLRIENINGVDFKLIDFLITFKNKEIKIRLEAMIVNDKCFSISPYKIKCDETDENKKREMLKYFSWRKEIVDIIKKIN